MVKLTTEVNEEAFVIALQHGDNDVTCKRSLAEQRGGYAGTNCFLPLFFEGGLGTCHSVQGFPFQIKLL